MFQGTLSRGWLVTEDRSTGPKALNRQGLVLVLVPRISSRHEPQDLCPDVVIPRQAALLRFMRKLQLDLSVVSRRCKLRTIFFRREQFCGAQSLRTVLAPSPKLTSRTP